MAPMHKTSVIIPHYQDPIALDLCLASLERQTYPRDHFEVVVADNDSPMGSEAVRAVIAGRARLVVCHERGAGPARNAGVAASDGEILAFTDCDCVPEAVWLAKGVAALAAYDLIGGRMTVLVDNEDAPTPAEAFETIFAFDNETYVTRKGFTVTANLFCPRRVFEAVGPFQAQVSEDVDWSHRAVAAGYRLGYAPDAVVGHPARRTWDQLLLKWRRVNAEMLSLHRKGGGSTLAWLAKCAALPLSAVLHTPKALGARRPGRLSARLAAVGILFRLRLWRAVDGAALLAATRRGD